MRQRRSEVPEYHYRPAEIHPAAGRLPQRCTAAAILVRRGRLLLEWRPVEAPVYPSLWDIPGGHLEAGETPEAALEREMIEELGIRPLRFFLGATQDDRDPATGTFYRHFVFVVREWAGRPVPREGRTVRWLRLARVWELDPLNPLVGFALRDFLSKGWIES